MEEVEEATLRVVSLDDLTRKDNEDGEDLAASDSNEAIQILLSALKSQSFVAISLSPAQAHTIQSGFTAAKAFFGGNSQNTKEQYTMRIPKWGGYYRSTAKEVFNFRKYGKSFPVVWPTYPDDLVSVLERVFNLAQEIAHLVLRYLLEDMEIDYLEVMQQHADVYPIDLNPGGYSRSVLDLFHYYNSPEVASYPNCAEHADPGFITVACKGTTPGLQAFDWANEEWIEVEELLQPNEVLVFLGEATTAITNQRLNPTLHRVVKGETPRLNIIYEMRPIADIVTTACSLINSTAVDRYTTTTSTTHNTTETTKERQELLTNIEQTKLL